MLKVQEKSKPETAVWLNKKAIAFANSGTADLYFTTCNDEPSKAKIEIIDNNVYLTDLSFNFSISLNQQAIAPGSKIKLKHGDCFCLGQTGFELIDPKQVLSSFSANEDRQNASPSSPAKPDERKLNNKQWITKPTSIGNRANDSLDLILAEHQKKKRQLAITFLCVGMAVGAALFYFLY